MWKLFVVVGSLASGQADLLQSKDSYASEAKCRAEMSRVLNEISSEEDNLLMAARCVQVPGQDVKG